MCASKHHSSAAVQRASLIALSAARAACHQAWRLVLLRAMCQAGRATAARGTTYEFLAMRAPVWVIARVCELLWC